MYGYTNNWEMILLKRIKRKIISVLACFLFIGVFSIINPASVNAEAITDYLGAYEITGFTVSNGVIDIKGWFVAEAQWNYHLNDHTYTLNVGGNIYSDLNDYNVSRTEYYKLAQTANNPCSDAVGPGNNYTCYYTYDDVGFHFRFPLSDLDKMNFTSIQPVLYLKDRKGKTWTTKVKFVSSVANATSSKGYKYSFNTSINTSSLKIVGDQVLVRKGPGREYGYYTDGSRGYNWEVGAVFNHIYDVRLSDHVNWYKVKINMHYKNQGYGTWPLAYEGTTYEAWIQGNFAALSGEYFTITKTIPKFTVTFKDWNGAVISTQTINIGENATAPANPKRNGYTFIGWDKGFTNIQADTTVTAKYDKNPSLSLKSFSVIEGDAFPVSNLIDGNGYITSGDSQFPSKLVEVHYPATASDTEDGNLTSKITVTKVVSPSGAVVSNVDTRVVGNYTVYYQVKDSVGGIATATRTITVLPASTPVILANDRYFYRGSQVTEAILISKIKATDKYDGNITPKVTIPDFANIDAETKGEYEITYSITNRSNKTTTKKVIVHIIETISDMEHPGTIRFINNLYLDTLDENSKWRTDAVLSEKLKKSLEKKDESEAEYIYYFTNEEIKEKKQDIKNNGFR